MEWGEDSVRYPPVGRRSLLGNLSGETLFGFVFLETQMDGRGNWDCKSRWVVQASPEDFSEVSEYQ